MAVYKEISCWLHREALEVKDQRTTKLIRIIKGREEDDESELESSSEEKENDDVDNISVEILRYV